MFRQLFTLGLVSLIAAVPTVALASAQIPRPDENGNYYDIAEAFIWIVVDPDPNGLNCRSGPGTEYSVIEVKSPNERLFLVNIHFGGGPPYINFDERGLPWLKVDGGYETYCFVRANTLFIEPTRERIERRY